MKTARIFMLSALCCAVSGCAGGGLPPREAGLPQSTFAASSNDVPSRTFKRGSLTTAQRIGAMNAVAAYFAKLPHKNPLADAKALQAFIRKRSEFESAQIDADQLWARFIDGTQYAVVNAPAPSTPVKSSAAAEEMYREVSDAASTKKVGPNAFVLGNSRFFSVESPVEIGKALEDVGYHVYTDDVTLDVLRNKLKNVHVLFIDSHGAEDYNKDTPSEFGILTATTVSANNDTTYAGDIADGSIYFGMGVYLKKVAGKTQERADSVYVVSPKFFKKYATFQDDTLDDSLVFVNTCFSASPPAKNSLQSVLSAKGVTAYLGWTKATLSSDAVRAALNFFDRTLPEDRTHDDLPVAHKSPPEPAALELDAYAWMQQHRLTESHNPENAEIPPHGQGDVSALEYEDFAGGFPQLAPILATVGTQEDQGVIDGYGSFGKSNVKPVWGIAQSPPKGSGATIFPKPHPPVGTSDMSEGVESTIPSKVTNGYVRVFVDGIVSNEAPLTEWQGTITVSDVRTYSGSETGTLTFNGTLNVNVRTEVAPVRKEIDGPLSDPIFAFGDAMPNSTGVLGGSGSLKSSGETATYSSNDQSAVPYYTNPSSTANFELGGTSSISPCYPVVSSPATVCLYIQGEGNNVATCSGALCSLTQIPWAFQNAGAENPGPIPLEIDYHNYTLSAPKSTFEDIGGQGWTGETTYSFTFGPPQSPPTAGTSVSPGNRTTRDRWSNRRHLPASTVEPSQASSK